MKALGFTVCLACLVSTIQTTRGTELGEAVEAELRSLTTKVPAFQVVALRAAPGEVVLKPEHALTIDRLRNVDLDDDPPKLGKPSKPYDTRMTDGYPPGEAPYVARGIRPFRLKHFHCEFNYGGWHNFPMADYAAAHGFRIIYPYVREMDQKAHLPAGTLWLGWGGFINWHKWFGEHGLPDGRYDLLANKDLVQIHIREGKFARPVGSNALKHHGDYLMIDMEHPVLSPENLRRQDWYPQSSPDSEQSDFEKKYYDGYAQTYISAVKAAREQGWRNISLYGWAPYGRTWGGLEQPEVAPGTDHAWNMFGKQIYDVVDIVNNSVYCFYWSPQNVAYTLANIDSNRALIESMPERRPMRPYFWTLLHGGGGGWRWWKGQPLANEEKRAMIAMAFFTGIDGFDTWNWSGTGNHHVPPPLTRLAQSDDYFASGRDVMLEKGFQAVPKIAPDGAPPEQFQRYDVLHVLDVDTEKGLAEFQKIRHAAKNHGVTDDQPVFTMPIEQLESHLRIKSEPVAAMIEGMALVKPLEYTLRHGVVKVDIPARDQFKHTLPIVRRIKIGPIHVLCTYDPKVIYGGEPREIVLSDFDGCPGRTLKIPADSETRIFVMREEAPSKSETPPISRIQFGSCIREDKPMAILEKMAERQPDLLIFLGDNIYADTTDMDVMRDKYRELKTNQLFARLLEACPVLATWDDHDYGANDAGAEYPRRVESQRIFVDFWGDPADSPRRHRPGVYEAYVFGSAGKRVQVILLDTRYFRGPLKQGERRVGGPYYPAGDETIPLLGEQQWAWLEKQMQIPAEIRIIASSIQCIAESSGQETWSNLPHERQRLFRLISRSRADGVMIISGDRHWSEFSVSTDAVPYPLYDFTSSSLNQIHPRGTPTANRFRARPKTYHRENFGEIVIDWDQPDPEIVITIRDDTGGVQLETKLRLGQLRN